MGSRGLEVVSRGLLKGICACLCTFITYTKGHLCLSLYVPMLLCLYLRPPRGVGVQGKGGRPGVRGPGVGELGSVGKVEVQGVRSPGARFTGVEGDQRRRRRSGVGERVGGMASG